jgi:hypothetical protein
MGLDWYFPVQSVQPISASSPFAFIASLEQQVFRSGHCIFPASK